MNYKLVNGEEVLVKGGAVRILEAVRKGKETTRSRHSLGGNEGEGVEITRQKGIEAARHKGNEIMRQPAHTKALVDKEEAMLPTYSMTGGGYTKRPPDLFVCDVGNTGQRLGTCSNHENATCILLF